MNKEITVNSTGKIYSVEHLRPFPVTYSIKIKDEHKDISLQVLFSNHCYTRSRKKADLDEDVLFSEPRRNSVDERVFCEERWRFSQELPAIIRALHNKLCFSGKSKELFYRQEKPTRPGEHAGWYICAKLGYSQKHQNHTLSIRSVHWRTNRPIDIRGGSKRFYVLLAKYCT